MTFEELKKLAKTAGYDAVESFGNFLLLFEGKYYEEFENTPESLEQLENKISKRIEDQKKHRYFLENQARLREIIYDKNAPLDKVELAKGEMQTLIEEYLKAFPTITGILVEQPDGSYTIEEK
jgi:hypothetical protein